MNGVEGAEYALRTAEKLGVEYAEAYAESAYGRSFAISQGIVEGSAYSEETGLRVRLLKKGSLCTFSTNKLEKENLKWIISRFRVLPGVKTRLSSEKQVNADCKIREKKRIDEADMLKDLIRIDKELSKVKSIKYRSMFGTLGRSKTYFVNSEGSTVRGDTPYVFSAFDMTVSNGKESRQSLAQLGTTGGYEHFEAGKIAEDLLKTSKSLYAVLEKGVTLSEDKLRSIKKIVIAPEISGIAAHESIGHPCEADRIFGREAAQAGTSYLNGDNLGLEIGSEAVNVIDDPTLKGTNGFYLYDEEGVKARPRVLVEKGVQKELLLNREYANVLGKKSNGSARSNSYANEPMLRMANTYLKPGRATLEELLSEARDGLYVKKFSSTEWNIDDTRSFERYAGNEVYVIKNGSLEEPVKNYKIETSTLDFWHAVKLVGNDLGLYTANCGKGEPMQGVPVTCGGASAFLEFR